MTCTSPRAPGRRRRARTALGLVPFVALLAGCGEIVFTEADEGQDREVPRGDSFTVSIPAVNSAQRPDPLISGAYVRVVEHRLDEDREVFRFVAEGQGESEIRIPPPSSAASQPEFVIRVRIRVPAALPPAGARPADSQKKF